MTTIGNPDPFLTSKAVRYQLDNISAGGAQQKLWIPGRSKAVWRLRNGAQHLRRVVLKLTLLFTFYARYLWLFVYLNNKELSTSNNYKRISYTSWKYNMFPVPGSVICMLLWDLRPPYGLPFECNLQHFRATTFDLHPISSIWKPYAAYIRPMCSPHRSI